MLLERNGDDAVFGHFGAAAGYALAAPPDGCAACFGFVYIPAVAAIGLASILLAPFGAMLSGRLPPMLLRRLSGSMLVLAAVSLLVKKLPEITAQASAALAVPGIDWRYHAAPAQPPIWLSPDAGKSASIPSASQASPEP